MRSGSTFKVSAKRTPKLEWSLSCGALHRIKSGCSSACICTPSTMAVRLGSASLDDSHAWPLQIHDLKGSCMGIGERAARRQVNGDLVNACLLGSHLLLFLCRGVIQYRQSGVLSVLASLCTRAGPGLQLLSNWWAIAHAAS